MDTRGGLVRRKWECVKWKKGVKWWGREGWMTAVTDECLRRTTCFCLEKSRRRMGPSFYCATDRATFGSNDLGHHYLQWCRHNLCCDWQYKRPKIYRNNDNHLWPILAHFSSNDYIFQDDNAPVHRTRSVKEFWNKKIFQQWNGLFNVLTYIWQKLKQESCKRVQNLRTANGMETVVHQKWENIHLFFQKRINRCLRTDLTWHFFAKFWTEHKPFFWFSNEICILTK